MDTTHTPEALVPFAAEIASMSEMLETFASQLMVRSYHRSESPHAVRADVATSEAANAASRALWRILMVAKVYGDDPAATAALESLEAEPAKGAGSDAAGA